jgi:hypothetical protein
MTRETIAEKARRYLVEGRLVVELVVSGDVRARCRGGGAVYRLGFVEGRWWCECPAHTGPSTGSSSTMMGGLTGD